MADLSVSGNRPATNPLPAAEAFAPGDVLKEVAAAQKRMEQDRIEAQNPGLWQRTKEVFSSGSKREREGRIRNAERMDKIMDDLYQLIFRAYQGMINPQASSSA